MLNNDVDQKCHKSRIFFGKSSTYDKKVNLRILARDSGVDGDKNE